MERYGHVDRFQFLANQAGNTDHAAQQDLNSYKKGQMPNAKDLGHFPPTPPGALKSITTASGKEHARYRKLLAPAFSPKALEEQQPIINKYVDQLIQVLSGESGKNPVDISSFLHWTLFDIIGDLTFGESFGGLEFKRYDPWIQSVFYYIKLGRIAGYLSHQFWIVRKILPYIIPQKIREKQAAHYQRTSKTLKTRLDKGATERPDFMSLILRNQGKDDELTFQEMVPNASSLILAGSETTSTLLSGAIFLLAQHREVYKKASTELRDTFRKDSNITFREVDKLPYLDAVLKESLRLYPPIPAGLDRIVADPAGITVAGHWLPQGTMASVHQLAANTYSECWVGSTSFIPERWLGDPKFEHDERDILQPFNVGPRDCIGRNLAYINMRLILARILHKFDIQLVNEGQDWIGEQKIYSAWEKLPLTVYLRSAPVAA
ncbi:hypothetical protein LTR84_005512 [Exophiala bonariae]|uniref:Cytochrome P450 n=1 Tax=Exophiala bonariae TaxID=1690606 RepID=A0AAV9N844_9EURO|nr:hypothetical protein LTR84_005512 [Exophiala bonariae]